MKEITVEALINNIPVVTGFVDEQLEQLGTGLKQQMAIDVAIDELFTNIASYAYPGSSGQATIRFEFDPTDRMASITLVDSGVPFDPLQKPDPDTSLPAEEREIGGLGIFLVKKTMDDVIYRREDGRNLLTIRKKI